MRLKCGVAFLALWAYLLVDLAGEETGISLALLFLCGLAAAWQLSCYWHTWLIPFGFLAYHLCMDPYGRANHHFALLYVCLAMACCLSATPNQREHLVGVNARWLLIGIMGFATMHKVLSPEFLDGSYTGFLLATGSIGRFVSNIVALDDILPIIELNRSLIDTLADMREDKVATVHLRPIGEHFRIFAYGFTALTLISEGWLFLCYAFWPDHKLAPWSALAFAATLAFIRPELIFIAILTSIALMAWRKRTTGICILLSAACMVSLLIGLFFDRTKAIAIP